MADLSPRWSTDLTDEQRAAWAAIAPVMRDTLGQPYTLTPQQTFLRSQLYRSLGGLPFSADPPERGVVTFTALELVAVGSALNLTWTATGPVGTQIYLQGAAPANAGRTFIATWRQFYLVGIAGAQPLNIAAGYAIDFGGAPPSGSRVWVRGRAVGPSGLDLSSRLIANVIVP